mmetsp:Transcript_53748/g.135116  ORF Transcript_53748/g.135116 Transcript_53748/m.135116 type:complete len:80 (+) Transcript_53748:20-259(+)
MGEATDWQMLATGIRGSREGMMGGRNDGRRGWLEKAAGRSALDGSCIATEVIILLHFSSSYTKSPLSLCEKAGEDLSGS